MGRWKMAFKTVMGIRLAGNRADRGGHLDDRGPVRPPGRGQGDHHGRPARLLSAPDQGKRLCHHQASGGGLVGGTSARPPGRWPGFFAGETRHPSPAALRAATSPRCAERGFRSARGHESRCLRRSATSSRSASGRLWPGPSTRPIRRPGSRYKGTSSSRSWEVSHTNCTGQPSHPRWRCRDLRGGRTNAGDARLSIRCSRCRCAARKSFSAGAARLRGGCSRCSRRTCRALVLPCR